MQKIAARKGESFAELAEMPDYSPDIAHHWEMYLSLNKGCADLTYEAIDAYVRLTHKKFTHWEINLMLDIDVMRRTNG